MSDLFDFEVDQLVVESILGVSHIEPLSVAELAAQQCASRRGAPRRDDIYRAFFTSGADRHAFAAFRGAYIAEFRSLLRECPGNDPEAFFTKRFECHCAECSKQHAA